VPIGSDAGQQVREESLQLREPSLAQVFRCSAALASDIEGVKARRGTPTPGCRPSHP